MARLLVLSLVAVILLPGRAGAVRQELKYLDQSETNYIGGSLPRITLAQPWRETCDGSGCRYPFKLVFTRVGKDKQKLAPQGTSDPVGKFMYLNAPRWSEVFGFYPNFAHAASQVFAILKKRMVPPLKFSVTYTLDLFEARKVLWTWIPVRAVNFLKATPLGVENWSLREGGRKIALLQYKSGGFAPGTYILTIHASAKLDQWYLKTVASGLVGRAGVPFILSVLGKWAAEQATKGWTRYLLKVPAKVPKFTAEFIGDAATKRQAVRMIQQRRLTPVVVEKKTGVSRQDGKVAAQTPAPGQWLWKGQKVTITCLRYRGTDASGKPSPCRGPADFAPPYLRLRQDKYGCWHKVNK